MSNLPDISDFPCSCEEGLRGPRGEQGDTGSQGDQGPPGDKGRDGNPGPDGLEGDKGPIGPKGNTGADGVDAPDGRDWENMGGLSIKAEGIEFISEVGGWFLKITFTNDQTNLVGPLKGPKGDDC